MSREGRPVVGRAGEVGEHPMGRQRRLRVGPLLIPLVVAGAVPAVLGQWLSGPRVPLAGWAAAVGGGALVVPGGWMVADAVDRVYLRQATPLGDRPPERLVRSGWYAVVRNPMAAGMTLVLAGETLLWSAPSIALWAAFVLGVSWTAVRRVEEPSLAETFGEEYAAYRRAVPAWIPGTAVRHRPHPSEE
ncbi:protein-S-isoprenylcysteine O-methyltransferase Ste14 [Streptomyces sp. SAI-126]|uniref:methyltransferase family protein n=1 Tax=Streptomyces sp. SAI-126 TaxID=3377732 RepID=UPI000FAF8DB6